MSLNVIPDFLEGSGGGEAGNERRSALKRKPVVPSFLSFFGTHQKKTVNKFILLIAIFHFIGGCQTELILHSGVFYENFRKL